LKAKSLFLPSHLPPLQGAGALLHSFKFLVMKKYTLFLIVRVEVETSTDNLFKAITELESQTSYEIGSTENVKVLETQILETVIPNS